MPAKQSLTATSAKPVIKTCYLFRDLYDCVRNRPFNKPFDLIHADGSVDSGLNSEQAMKDCLWERNNPFLQKPVTFRC